MECNSEKTNLKIQIVKDNFVKKREKIKKIFFEENKALNNCKSNTQLIDNLISEIFKILESSIIEEKNKTKFCICAVGGYGRGVLAPFSDLDILFLYDAELKREKILSLIESILFPLWDLGFKIGYAVRTPEESTVFSRKDHIIQTSMLDARLICGSKKIYHKVMKDFSNDMLSFGTKLLKNKIIERKKRIIELGYDYFKNEPNLKESEGSLRDINLIFWGLKIFHFSNRQEPEKNFNFLTFKEKKKLRSSLEFLLLLRCHLHYQSERSNDKLSFDYQKAISIKIFKSLNLNHRDNPNIYVEKMMKDYFREIRNTKNLAEIFSQILEEELKNNTKELKYLIPKKKPQLILNSFLNKLSKGTDKPNDKRIILEYVNKLSEVEVFNPDNIKLFKKIFFSLKKERFILLFDIGIISKIIPEFSKIAYLPQFDRYHSLTVGQHTLKAVNILKDLEDEKIKKNSYKFYYKELKKKYNKRALYYATLLHDIGKGRGGEHNIKGSKIAKQIVLRFNESTKTAEDTSWLVYNHSLLSDYAFKKDFEDFSLIRNISNRIKNMERLRCLFLLTVTDISAVDQGLWNNWKASLLRQLYLKLEKQIKEPKMNMSLNDKIEQIRSNILKKSKKITVSKIQEIARISYPNYWLLQSEETIIFQIENFFLKQRKDFDFNVRSIKENNFFDLIIVTKDKHQLFLNLISIFVLDNLSILEARIFTLDDGTAIDTFKFSFNDNSILRKYDIERAMNSLENKLQDIGKGKIFKIKEKVEPKLRIIKKYVDVKVDNESSSTYTILMVKTNDRPKLLYDISKILIKNKIIISMAKISTYGDFAEDSFHLRSEYGLKIENQNLVEKIINEIKNKLNESLKNAY